MAEKDNAETAAERAKAIKAAFPDNPQFALDQIIAGHSVAEAKAAYADVLQAQLKQEREQHKAAIEAAREEALAAKTVSRQPIKAHGSTTAEKEQGRDVNSEWRELVQAGISRGLSRPKAVRAASVENPELHQLYLANVNNGQTFESKNLRHEYRSR